MSGGRKRVIGEPKISLAEFFTTIGMTASAVALILTLIFNGQIQNAQQEYTTKLEYLLEVETFQEKNASDRLTRHENSIMDLKLNDQKQEGAIVAIQEDVAYIRDKVDQLVGGR